ncbi:hypothetical protein Q4543_05090 [Salipiger sp. 1_MG-2023]|uniref:hypothetical protein n=1 Tax=Salipiger sp. 1_MG-2023 TaxID=3062665 RepID=UPI0026E1E929|nr:hypothetical protein [Salipiger sp. 1_MG-2023]MDO6584885.1 hypothetical protein [Salipiger sp. 1_MG-2023]
MTNPAPAPSPRPTLDAWLSAGQTGAGTPWLSALQAESLARYALMRGYGVRLMEASALTLHEPPRDTDWEILGADAPGSNWEDHHNPACAFRLLVDKLTLARRAGARLQYKLWLGRA